MAGNKNKLPKGWYAQTTTQRDIFTVSINLGKRINISESKSHQMKNKKDLLYESEMEYDDYLSFVEKKLGYQLTDRQIASFLDDPRQLIAALGFTEEAYFIADNFLSKYSTFLENYVDSNEELKKNEEILNNSFLGYGINVQKENGDFQLYVLGSQAQEAFLKDSKVFLLNKDKTGNYVLSTRRDLTTDSLLTEIEKAFQSSGEKDLRTTFFSNQDYQQYQNFFSYLLDSELYTPKQLATSQQTGIIPKQQITDSRKTEGAGRLLLDLKTKIFLESDGIGSQLGQVLNNEREIKGYEMIQKMRQEGYQYFDKISGVATADLTEIALQHPVNGYNSGMLSLKTFSYRGNEPSQILYESTYEPLMPESRVNQFGFQIYTTSTLYSGLDFYSNNERLNNTYNEILINNIEPGTQEYNRLIGEAFMGDKYNDFEGDPIDQLTNTVVEDIMVNELDLEI